MFCHWLICIEKGEEQFSDFEKAESDTAGLLRRTGLETTGLVEHHVQLSKASLDQLSSEFKGIDRSAEKF